MTRPTTTAKGCQLGTFQDFWLVLEDFGDISATTNSLYGVIGFIIASFVGFLASYFHNNTLNPIFILMITTSFLSFIILLYIKISKV